ncbi:MAG: flagellar hook-associated 2 domain protein, partial [Paenibacillus sp.]|nr:flagellar hook-associated 2 domain protein [Paenibacillus sp.]
EFDEVSNGGVQDNINILDQLGLSDPDSFTTVTDQKITKLSAEGKNAIIEYNGLKDGNGDNEEISYSSNNFTVNGVSVTLKKVSTEDVTVSVSTNTDAVYDKIKNFVDQYNSLITDIAAKTGEERNRDYTPLTDAQKEAMSEEQVKSWEAKAKAGLLRSDSILTNALYSFRNSLVNVVSGLSGNDLKQLSQLGITTGTSYVDNGKLSINEEKLRQAIADRPDEIAALFTVDDGNAKTDSGDGLAVRLHKQATDLIDRLKATAGTTDMTYTQYETGKKLSEIEDQITRLQDRMDDAEDRYYSQFTAMEKYINQLNQQSSWLAQQLGTTTQSS